MSTFDLRGMEEHSGRLAIDDRGYSVSYRVFGTGQESFLHLHGGPGAGSTLALPFATLARSAGVKVAIYDQLGCGQSDHPNDPSLWTIRRFTDEVEAVRVGLALGQIHLMGRSWGGMLALQYALDYPGNLRSLILSNTAADAAAMSASVQKRYMELPAEVYRDVLRYTHGETLSVERFTDMMAEFLGRHMRRPTPFDPDVAKRYWLSGRIAPMERFLDNASFRALWGPKITQCTGPITQWNVTDRLQEIKVPTLILCGWYDEIAPELHRMMADRIPDNEFIIFGNSSHLITEEKEGANYLGVISNFLQRVSV